MRTLLFTLFILLVVGGGIWYRFWRDDSPGPKNRSPVAIIEPVSEWSKILPGKWHMQWKFNSSDLGWLEEADIEYFTDGKFKKHTLFTNYGWNDPNYTNDKNLDIFENGKKMSIQGGMISGKWRINPDKGNWEETVTSFEVPGMIHPNMVVDKFPFGNYENATLVTHVEFFTHDSIMITGKDYSGGEKISFFFKRTD